MNKIFKIRLIDQSSFKSTWNDISKEMNDWCNSLSFNDDHLSKTSEAIITQACFDRMTPEQAERLNEFVISKSGNNLTP